MDAAEIVRLVVEEALRRLGLASARPAARVLAPRDPSLEARVAPLAARILGEGATLLFEGEEGSASLHVLPELSCSDMADLAAGRASTPLTREVLDLLLEGREVRVLDFGHRRRRATAPAPLYALYEGYRKTLEGFGLKELADGAGGSPFAGSLVSAEDVRKAAADGARVLRVRPSARVTPLARDVAKELGVDISADSEART